jgi:hypothetical protein
VRGNRTPENNNDHGLRFAARLDFHEIYTFDMFTQGCGCLAQSRRGGTNIKVIPGLRIEPQSEILAMGVNLFGQRAGK